MDRISGVARPESKGVARKNHDEQGKITQGLHEPTGNHLKEITSAREYGGYLYLGSLHNDRIGKFKLPG